MEVLKSWKIVEFLKISIKIRNCKIFYLNRPKQRATLGKSFCVTPNDPPLDKVLLREIYRHFLSNISLSVKKWCSANVFSNIKQKHVCWKNFKSERLLAVLQERVILNAKWIEVRKMSEVFWAKLYCKMSDLFC